MLTSASRLCFDFRRFATFAWLYNSTVSVSTARSFDSCFLREAGTCKKGSPYSITDRRVPGLIMVLGSQPAGDVSHKPGGRPPLILARPAVTPATLKRTATNFAAW